MSEGGEPTSAAAGLALPWKLARGQATHRFGVWLPEGLRDRLDDQWERLRAIPRTERPWPLTMVDSLRDLVALACDELCTRAEQTYGRPLPDGHPGPIHLGPVVLGSSAAAPTYVRPWELIPGEDRIRLQLRLPSLVWQRLEGLHGWLEPHLIRSGPERSPVISIGDLVVLACHELCGALTLPTTNATATADRRSLYVESFPGDLHAALRRLRDQLQEDPPPQLLAELGAARTLSDLVALACQRLVDQLTPPAADPKPPSG